VLGLPLSSPTRSEEGRSLLSSIDGIGYQEDRADLVNNKAKSANYSSGL